MCYVDGSQKILLKSYEHYVFFITRWKQMEKSEYQICEDKLTTSNMVLSKMVYTLTWPV